MAHIRSLNRVTLVGRVGRNPELTYLTGSGRDLSKFSMVTNEGYYDKDRNWKESSEWHNIVTWGPQAQRIEKQVKKGDLVLVEGKIRTNKWTDKNGQERSNKEIEANNVIVLDKRQRDYEGGADQSSSFQSDSNATKGDAPFTGLGGSGNDDFSFEDNSEEPF